MNHENFHLTHASNELQELKCFLDVIAEKDTSREGKEELAREAVAD
jgi:hypothetical protein